MVYNLPEETKTDEIIGFMKIDGFLKTKPGFVNSMIFVISAKLIKCWYFHD